MLGEVPSLACGLIAYSWIAVALVAGGRRETAAVGEPRNAEPVS